MIEVGREIVDWNPSAATCLVSKDGFLFWAKEARQSEIEALRERRRREPRLQASLDSILRVFNRPFSIEMLLTTSRVGYFHLSSPDSDRGDQVWTRARHEGASPLLFFKDSTPTYCQAPARIRYC